MLPKNDGSDEGAKETLPVEKLFDQIAGLSPYSANHALETLLAIKVCTFPRTANLHMACTQGYACSTICNGVVSYLSFA